MNMSGAKMSARFPTRFHDGGSTLRPLRVAGVYRDYSNDRGTVMMDRDLYLALFHDSRVTSVAVFAARRRP